MTTLSQILPYVYTDGQGVVLKECGHVLIAAKVWNPSILSPYLSREVISIDAVSMAVFTGNNDDMRYPGIIFDITGSDADIKDALPLTVADLVPYIDTNRQHLFSQITNRSGRTYRYMFGDDGTPGALSTGSCPVGAIYAEAHPGVSFKELKVVIEAFGTRM